MEELRKVKKSDIIRKRAVDCANYMIEKSSTVRATAVVFNVSKSTVHKDLNDRLPEINNSLYLEVRKIIDKNLLERHSRSGEATRKAYLKKS